MAKSRPNLYFDVRIRYITCRCMYRLSQAVPALIVPVPGHCLHFKVWSELSVSAYGIYSLLKILVLIVPLLTF